MAKASVYTEHLKGNQLFAGLTKKELQHVASAGTEVGLKAGATVMKEGQSGRTAIVLLNGTMVISRGGKKLREVGPGEVIGEMSLLDDQPRSATVECVTDCTVLEIIGGQFRDVLDEVPSIRIRLLEAMAGRVRELDFRRLI